MNNENSVLELSDLCFDKYIALVHSLTGIRIEKNRKAMLVGRIRRRVKELGLKSYDEYLGIIKKNQQEENVFVNSVTTNETYFYRTPRVWDFFTQDFLPKWNPKQKLRLWSAASSTGEEAYTAGIFCEEFHAQHPEFRYQILGTDISSDVVKKASEGLYIGRPVERFRVAKPELFKKYMVGDDTSGHKVIPEIKTNISFETHNLFEKMRSGPQFDLIFLRNVLIYFTKEDQERVLGHIGSCLSLKGNLIIGESESIARLETKFVSDSPLIYRFKDKSQEEAA